MHDATIFGPTDICPYGTLCPELKGKKDLVDAACERIWICCRFSAYGPFSSIFEFWPVKIHIVPPLNIPIPTKLGPKMVGAPTHHWCSPTASFFWEGGEGKRAMSLATASHRLPPTPTDSHPTPPPDLSVYPTPLDDLSTPLDLSAFLLVINGLCYVWGSMGYVTCHPLPPSHPTPTPTPPRSIASSLARSLLLELLAPGGQHPAGALHPALEEQRRGPLRRQARLALQVRHQQIQHRLEMGRACGAQQAGEGGGVGEVETRAKP